MNFLKHAEPAADSGLVQFARTWPSLALPTALALAVIAVPVLVTASGRAAIREGPMQVRITERDFSISAPRVLSPGTVSLRVRNAGPNTHEFVVARADASRLPLRSDGLTVDEEALEPRILGMLEPGAPGDVRTLRVHLSPGRYVLFCNMSGHYLGGMRRTLVVR
jgi:hypothetical protein